ncbi:MAG: sulfatase-like hydrolase/transferase, partial [Lachnospiraceae bacterium]|nr:sulfatase-like hydrolase/transferase [Lachnospiraceae bacterium]
MANNDIAKAESLLDEYCNYAKEDLDIYALETNLYICKGEYEKAYLCAIKGVKQKPLNGDMLYNAAYACELTNRYMEAYIYYYKARYIYEYNKREKQLVDELKESEERILEQYISCCDRETDMVKIKENKKIIDALVELSKVEFGLVDGNYRSYSQVIGNYIYENINKKRYAAIYKDQVMTYLDSVKGVISESYDLTHLKGELLEVKEGNCNEIDLDNNIEYLLPIASEKCNNVHKFESDEGKYSVLQFSEKHFNYYKIKGKTKVYSNNKAYYGNAIPLVYDSNKKKLVLSIFVDGLGTYNLKNEKLKEWMPNTYKFFEKGIVFNNAYNMAEWTYPSIANIMSGLDTIHHGLFHNALDGNMPEEVPVFAEYMKEQGYYTAMIGGNWRIIPPYGNARGIDRYIYQHQKAGFKVHEVICDTINHIEAFKDTNQYLWISIGDLHDIADGDDLPIDVQKAMEQNLREYEDKGITSAKQDYSEKKSEMFNLEARHIDRWLKVLYEYIEENFKDTEIVVSLFSDHGQGYFIKPGEHFLAPGRSNIAFMFRGEGCSNDGAEEIVSSVDYGCIMRKLCNIKERDDVKIDGVLPKTFGGCGRKFALTESIHPGDKYQAAIYTDDYVFYYINQGVIENDG